jgi:hypothetical protein
MEKVIRTANDPFDNSVILGQIFDLLEPYRNPSERADTFCVIIENNLKEPEEK